MLYTSGSESDYCSKTEFEDEVDLIDLSDSDKNVDTSCTSCKGDICTCDDDEFYKLQSQFQDLNMKTITSENVIELKINSIRQTYKFKTRRIIITMRFHI